MRRGDALEPPPPIHSLCQRRLRTQLYPDLAFSPSFPSHSRPLALLGSHCLRYTILTI